nr:immunoglobulin heavy chain junction region [Mus musculus]
CARSGVTTAYYYAMDFW